MNEPDPTTLETDDRRSPDAGVTVPVVPVTEAPEGAPAPGDRRPPLEPGLRLVLGYGLPSMVGVLAIHGMDLIDMFWVSRIGPEAVAAVALFVPVYMIFVSVNGFVGSGSVTLIARAFGRGDLSATADMIRQNFWAKLLIGSAAGWLGFALLDWSLGRLGAAPDVTAMSQSYGRVLMPFMGFTLAKFTCFTAFRCAGRPRTAMTMMLGAVTLNVVLDPVFIFGWGPVPALGLRGAAVASVISSCIILVVCLVTLWRGIIGVPVRFLCWPLVDRRTLGVLARVGIPQGVNNLLRALAMTVIMSMVTPYGTATVAVFGVAARIMRIGVELSGGFSLGMSSLVGQLLGASNPPGARRVVRYSLAVIASSLVVLVTFIILNARWVGGMFFDDPALVAQAAGVMSILVLATPLLGSELILNGVFSGAGYTLYPSLVRQGSVWLVQVPLLYLVAVRLQADTRWFWSLMVAGAGLMLIGSFTLYRRRGWERWRVTPAAISENGE